MKSPDRLRARLDAFARSFPERQRVAADPVELAHRYSEPRDVEVVALLCACLAYGRVDLFKPKLEALLARMGPSPAAFVRTLDVDGGRALLEGFVYRFNVPADLAVLLLGMGRALREHGSLEALFVGALEREGSVRGALTAFTAALRDVPMAPIRKALGRERGLHHLLPSGDGAQKRLNLFLRWMVRGPDAVDFGIWTRVPASALIIPLDTHIHRVSTRIGLTRRKSQDWATAAEITAALREVDPADPVRFDFALCHHGMSGACPPRPVPERCARCGLLELCATGRRQLRRR